MIPAIASPLLMSGGNSSGAPNPVNWPDISDYASYGETGLKAIAGISYAIQLQVTLSGVSLAHCAATLSASSGENVAVANGASFTLTVNPGDMLGFSVAMGAIGAPVVYATSGTVTVKYKSPGSSTFDVTLDTFTFSLVVDTR